MGLAAIQSSSTSTIAAAVPHPQDTPTTLSQLYQTSTRTFISHDPTIIANGAIAAARPRPIHGPRPAVEHRLVFDTSDARGTLDDWELEDYVLVATIEGNLYALDRQSGATKWVLDGGEPAVRSVVNTPVDPDLVNTTQETWKNEEQQPRWIVQPVEGGQLFLFEPEFGVLVHFFI
jgi:hypothetical protein